MAFDIGDISIEKLIGLSVGFFTPMNGGKTKAVVGELERSIHSGRNVMAYNSFVNIRDENNLVVDGRYKFPAKGAESVLFIKYDLERRRKIIMSRNVAHQGKNGDIVIDGIKHKKYKPLSAIAIDEVNLFCLTEKDTEDIIGFIDWCKHNDFVLYVSGLLYDFRQRDFGYVRSILPYINFKQERKPVCKAIKINGEQCNNTALHTQRLWRLDFVKEVGLETLIDEMEIFCFSDKKGKDRFDAYVPAPFFDKTVRIEEAKDGRNIYLPVCGECARLPYKEEVFRVYDAIIKRKDLVEVEKNHILREAIISFLSDSKEGWVEKISNPQKGDDRLVPINYYRNRIGCYSPKK
ncbi:MAG: hypothetical protein ABH824_03485 [Nanoarchaeota archaeon]|nr:hypothetical protein [Nanoarchaeota archaeon]MBU1632221.1 hypothetical protein [Nanoarchaeota archaeon]MBU1875517.1 hypothetical protein [Nanoarchaeota archaeon]